MANGQKQDAIKVVDLPGMYSRTSTEVVAAYLAENGKRINWCQDAREVAEDTLFRDPTDTLTQYRAMKGEIYCLKEECRCAIQIASQCESFALIYPENGAYEVDCVGDRTFKIVPKD